MQRSIIWWLFKHLFKRTKLVKVLKGIKSEDLERFKLEAIEKSDLEIAAILEYYIKFKRT